MGFNVMQIPGSCFKFVYADANLNCNEQHSVTFSFFSHYSMKIRLDNPSESSADMPNCKRQQHSFIFRKK